MVLTPAPLGGEPGVHVTPGLELHCVVMLLASAAQMSGTGGWYDFGLPQSVAVPEASALVTWPSWPLQSSEVFERIEQPDRLTTGAPLSFNATCDDGCP